MDVAALVAKAREQFEDAKPVDQGVLVAGEVLVVRMWPLTGAGWRELKANHPARTETVEVDGKQQTQPVASDRGFGFNLDAVVSGYPRVRIVKDGVEEEISPDEWADLCSVLSGPELDSLAMVVWGMNEYDPQQRLIAAGKALRAGRQKKRA